MDNHIKNIIMTKEFYEEYDELPSKRGIRPNEKSLGIWISHMYQNKKNSTLDPELEKKIREELPWLKLS